MKIEKRQKVPTIDDNAIVRAKRAGNITEIMCRKNQGTKEPCTIKVSKDLYLDKRNGELIEVNHIENRSQDMLSVSRSLALGRDMINANVTDTSKCRWVTLTYAENMRNAKKLMNDFKNLNKKLREKYGNHEYITAAEPQGRGAWHLHCVFIYPDKAPFIPNEDLAKMWGKGFVKIKKLDNVDNVGAYLTAYLGDMELPEDEKIEVPEARLKEVEIEEDGKKKTKRFIKGARLNMYPPGFHIFRYSRGCKKPEITHETYFEAKKKVCSHKQTFKKAIDISIEDKGFSDTLVYEYYNATITECQGKEAENAKIGNSHK